MGAPTRRQAGRRANRKGRAWEAQVAASAARYRKEGRAMVVQAFADGRQRRGPVDFVGTLEGGRAFAADAKATKGGRWPFSLLAPHQALQLRDIAAMGGVAGLLIRTDEGVAWVPWDAFGADYLRWLSEKGRPASLTVDAGTPVALDEQGLPDWLPAVLHGA